MLKSLSDRMKNYENSYRYYLPKRIPLILRLDGRSFSNYTKKLARPWDLNFSHAMDAVAKKLCEEIQGAQIAYIQSDEISVFVHNYKSLSSSAWFDNNFQKIVSISAAIASSEMTIQSFLIFNKIKAAQFDSRVIILPESEVCNYFIDRQNDATRNSIQSVAQSKFSHKQLYKKNAKEMQEMLFQVGINFNNLEPYFKRGRCCIKVASLDNYKEKEWKIDSNIPIFSSSREYIESLLAVDEK